MPCAKLSYWFKLSMKTLNPLSELIKNQIMTSDGSHTGDTPIDVLGQHFNASSRSGEAKEARADLDLCM
ncbi:hypothetical protein [Pseudovibrio axinellae]|uniref:hypothetical protein n=1 Tax=Pseudovibrio axinellae TaxID=989403 RepID=UPI0008326664|nr:hypothetical protein [Pseudovibrio axinellae]